MNRPIILIIFSVFIISGNLFGQSVWENVPQATQFSPMDMEFTDLNNGWVATVYGYIAHTDNGGDTWSLQGNYDPYNGANAIDMVSATHGYVALTQKIIETTDGENWNEIFNANGTGTVFRDIHFLNDTLGIVLSYNQILKTTDGGQSWTTIFSNPNFGFEVLKFVDENTIIAVGLDYGSGNILVSHDGGLTWSLPQEGAGLMLRDVYFLDNQTGFIIGSNGVFLKTTDGGLTWQSSTQFQNLLQPDPSIYFSTATTGFVSAMTGQFFRTTDGGNTWTDIFTPANRTYESIYFLDSLHGWAASSVLTEIIATSDGGLTWSSIYTGAGWPLFDVDFSSNNEGWACGFRGTVLHTLDGGMTWSLVESPLQISYHNLEIITPQKIWMVGDQGLSFLTTDGGANWYVIQISSQGGELLDIDFPTTQTGYVVGPGRIYKTVNGGSNWEDIWFPGSILFGCSFLNADTGMVASDNQILKTTDSGVSWDTISPPGANFYMDVAYPAIDTAYVVGGSGLIFSTYDGGNTWLQQNSGLSSTLTDVSFTSSTTGRASGYEGVILVTHDAGVTWIPETTPSQVQISAVATTPNQESWASKVDGNLLKFSCSLTDSMDINTYTQSPTNNCTGSVTLSSASGQAFVTMVSGQNQIINSSSDLSGFCEGLYVVGGYNSCGNGLNGRFVIPTPDYYFGTTSFSDSTIVSYLGNVQELCGQQLSTVTSAKLTTVSFINSTTIEATWELITASGIMQIPALYEVSEEGVYAIQLSLYCEVSSFEGLVVNENIYIENNTIFLKKSELQNESFTLFPNPTRDKINIRFESGTANLIVRDINGNKLFSKEITSNDQIDISDFSNGVFLFEVSTESGHIVRRVIKN